MEQQKIEFMKERAELERKIADRENEIQKMKQRCDLVNKREEVCKQAQKECHQLGREKLEMELSFQHKISELKEQIAKKEDMFRSQKNLTEDNSVQAKNEIDILKNRYAQMQNAC